MENHIKPHLQDCRVRMFLFRKTWAGAGEGGNVYRGHKLIGVNCFFYIYLCTYHITFTRRGSFIWRTVSFCLIVCICTVLLALANWNSARYMKWTGLYRRLVYMYVNNKVSIFSFHLYFNIFSQNSEIPFINILNIYKSWKTITIALFVKNSNIYIQQVLLINIWCYLNL